MLSSLQKDIPAIRTASPRQQLAFLPASKPASQPAFALPTATTDERNAMPGHCMRAEKHLRRALRALHPILPLYL